MNGFDARARAGALLLSALLPLIAAAGSGPQRLDGDAHFIDGAVVDVAPETWDGRFRFADVYCTTFPLAGKARQRVSALFHGNAVSLVKVAYDAPYEVYVATSTLPAGRTREDEHHQQLAGLQAGASVVPELLQYDVVELEHGPVIRTRMTNVTYPREGEDPFPLQMRFFDSPGAVRSIAESRLAIRAYDRVEVVALAAVPEGAGELEAALTRGLMAGIADAVLASLLECSATLPPP